PAGTQLGRHAAPRRLVDRPRPHRPRPRQLRHLLDLGCVDQSLLRVGTVSVAVLLSPDPDDLVAAVTRVPDSRLSTRLSNDLFLLPQSLLPLVFPRPRRVRGGRAPPRLPGRNEVSVHPAEPAPVHDVRRGDLYLHSFLRRDPRPALARAWRAGRRHDGAGPARVWHRRRHARHADQRRAARELHVRLPFDPTSDGRAGRLLLLRARGQSTLPGLARRERAESPSPAVRLVLAVFGRAD